MARKDVISVTREGTSGQRKRLKEFRCPDGLRVWNSADSHRETRFIYKEVFEQHCYEKHGITVRDGHLILDIGANVGLFPLSLMKRFQGLRFYCFEPVPTTRECLVRNLAECPARAYHEIEIRDHAVGASNSEAIIEYFPLAPANSTLYSAEKRQEVETIADKMDLADVWRLDKKTALVLLPLFPFRRHLFNKMLRKLFSNSERIRVRVQTLSEVLRRERIERVDYLKIDVEGAEMDIIEGIEDQHWPVISQIAMEVAPANKRQLPLLTSRLRSLGFTRITLESALGIRNVLEDPLPCTLYAIRSLRRSSFD